MLSLRELQQRFVTGLLSEDCAPVLPLLGEHGLPAAERFNIYRNNCRVGFHDVLATGYPVLRRLTGAQYFRQLAREYQREHPSPSGNLFHAGAKLPEYLAQRFGGSEFDYFSDVAALEWTCQQVLVAPDGGSIDVARLGAVSPSDYPRLHFLPDPALRLVSSRYPVVTIWEEHQGEREPGTIDLAAGSEHAAVQRRGEGVVIYRLPPAEYACLAAFIAGRPLGSAMTAALDIDPGFDLRGALRRWGQLGFIAGFSVKGESPQ
jgi:hypothetical protein